MIFLISLRQNSGMLVRPTLGFSNLKTSLRTTQTHRCQNFIFLSKTAKIQMMTREPPSSVTFPPVTWKKAVERNQATPLPARIPRKPPAPESNMARKTRMERIRPEPKPSALKTPISLRRWTVFQAPRIETEATRNSQSPLVRNCMFRILVERILDRAVAIPWRRRIWAWSVMLASSLVSQLVSHNKFQYPIIC